MLLTLVVSLYTSRIILNTLGVEDFGIYNVVGGFVTMFVFLNSAKATENPEALNTDYNTAFGDCTTLNDLLVSLKKYLSVFVPAIVQVHILSGPNRVVDIPHSLASINKAKKLLNYIPEFSM